MYNIVRDVILKHPCLDRLPITWVSTASMHHTLLTTGEQQISTSCLYVDVMGGPPGVQDSPGWALFMGFEHEDIHLETSSVLFRELPAHCLKKPIWVPPTPPIPHVNICLLAIHGIGAATAHSIC